MNGPDHCVLVTRLDRTPNSIHARERLIIPVCQAIQAAIRRQSRKVPTGVG